MTPNQLKKLERELGTFLDEMITGMGRPERRSAMRHYITGLLLDGERKSVQPMAARLTPDAAESDAMRQRLQDCVSLSPWSDEEMLRRLALKFDREMPGIEAFVTDDTGFAKKGEYSVGVARQYSGTLGRTDNCQVAVSLHLAGAKGSGCIAMRLYLPEEDWACDRKRRGTVGVPEEVQFRTKWEIALEQLDAALAAGVRRHLMLADAGYGDATEFRTGVEERGLSYIVAVSGVPTIWRPGVTPAVPNTSKVGRPSTRPKAREAPIRLSNFARELKSFRTVTWRDGSKGRMRGRFYAARVYSAERHTKTTRPALKPIWLIVEDAGEEKRPFKFYFSNLPESTSLKRLVTLIKLRWRVERDYQELKGEIGLDHFEGRTWRGFHHHATLCAVAHGFLALRRGLFPPEQSEVDPSGGASSSAAGIAAAHRMVPVLCQAHRRALATPGALADVTGCAS
ncbi:MAG: IS701 family transposase [Pseudonocardiaceae bacterium]